MKKVLLSTVCIFMMIIPAQTNEKADWQEYTGRYVLALGNSEETVNITLQGDSTLMIYSSVGEIALAYTGKDRFEFRQYGGVLVFERDEEQQVIACIISVAAMDLEDIKARKQ